MSELFYVTLCLIISYLCETEAARILPVFSAPSLSHQVVFRPLTQELAKRGHEVVVVTPDPAFLKGQTPDNLTEIDVHDVSYTFWKKQILNTKMGHKADMINQKEVVYKFFSKIVKDQLKNEEFKDLIDNKSDYFDLLMIEPIARPALALFHVFKVPVIQISSGGRYLDSDENIGAPMHPLMYSITTIQRINNLTLWDKKTELYNYYKVKQMFSDYEKEEMEIMRSVLGTDVPELSELKKNIDMLFPNSHPMWNANQPIPPNVVYLWGLYKNPVKDLPEDLKSYLDSSINGVIYMSFGTNSLPSLLPPEKIQMFVQVFSQLRYDVLWKWDKDELPGRSKNIRIGKWFPQPSLLKHPKIKLFITQGGLQSTDEAMSAGVPLIGLPLIGDQWFNVEKYVYHKIGVHLDLETLTEDQFRNAVHTVIGDESYRQNMVKLGIQMHDQPQPPLERAVWWTEHVLRHGGARHLRAPAANMSWWDFLELDLVFTVLLGLLVLVVVSVSIVYYLFNLMFRFFVEKPKLKRRRERSQWGTV